MISSLHSTSIPVVEPSQVGEARRAATEMGRRIGLDETTNGKAALIATEAATNLAKHAKDGRIIISPLSAPSGTGIEILALDKGPGIPDLNRCLQDGYSTKGSPGTGLGAMARMASHFEVYSRPQLGTAVLVQLWANGSYQASESKVQIGAVSVPYPREPVCGDSWKYLEENDRRLILVADGLGHGLHAFEAATEAGRILVENRAHSINRIIEGMHAALRKTRGAAIGLAELSIDRGIVQFAGIGNIAGKIASEAVERSLVSHNGIVGHEMRRVQEFSYPCPPGSLLVLHSDGLSANWNFGSFPGLKSSHPSLIAGVLLRDLGRNRDDATIVVIKIGN